MLYRVGSSCIRHFDDGAVLEVLESLGFKDVEGSCGLWGRLAHTYAIG